MYSRFFLDAVIFFFFTVLYLSFVHMGGCLVQFVLVSVWLGGGGGLSLYYFFTKSKINK